MKLFFVYVTVADAAEAKLIARTVVGERLAACSNVLGAIQSVYWWEGKLCESEEVALILKTSAPQVEALTQRIKQLHSYTCPCIVALPIAGGNDLFMDWIQAETHLPLD